MAAPGESNHGSRGNGMDRMPSGQHGADCGSDASEVSQLTSPEWQDVSDALPVEVPESEAGGHFRAGSVDFGVHQKV